MYGDEEDEAPTFADEDFGGDEDLGGDNDFLPPLSARGQVLASRESGKSGFSMGLGGKGGNGASGKGVIDAGRISNGQVSMSSRTTTSSSASMLLASSRPRTDHSGEMGKRA